MRIGTCATESRQSKRIQVSMKVAIFSSRMDFIIIQFTDKIITAERITKHLNVIDIVSTFISFIPSSVILEMLKSIRSIIVENLFSTKVFPQYSWRICAPRKKTIFQIQMRMLLSNPQLLRGSIPCKVCWMVDLSKKLE